jgi:hypothetical protein
MFASCLNSLIQKLSSLTIGDQEHGASHSAAVYGRDIERRLARCAHLTGEGQGIAASQAAVAIARTSGYADPTRWS